MTTTYKIIAYPHGARKVVATVHARRGDDAIATAAAASQAWGRGEYVDVERDGRCVAVIGPDGKAAH